MLELNYGDNYVKVDDGDIFVGSWDMLEDCFGITIETIDQWCEDSGYHYSVKKYTAADELLDSLYKLRGQLNKGNDWIDGAYSEYSEGTDAGMIFAADGISELINKFEKATN